MTSQAIPRPSNHVVVVVRRPLPPRSLPDDGCSAAAGGEAILQPLLFRNAATCPAPFLPSTSPIVMLLPHAVRVLVESSGRRVYPLLVGRGQYVVGRHSTRRRGRRHGLLGLNQGALVAEPVVQLHHLRGGGRAERDRRQTPILEGVVEKQIAAGAGEVPLVIPVRPGETNQPLLVFDVEHVALQGAEGVVDEDEAEQPGLHAVTQLLVLELDDGDVKERLLLLLHVDVVQGGATALPHHALHHRLVAVDDLVTNLLD